MNPFQKIKSKLDAKSEQEYEQQCQRIQRLKQLEAAQNQKGFHIPNPVQAMKDKKEIKQLRKEIAAFEESRHNTKFMIGCVAFVVVLICFCLIMATIENTSQSHMPETTDNIYLEGSVENKTSSAEEVIEASVEENNDGFFNRLNKDVPEFEFALNNDGKSYTLIDYNYLSPDASGCAEIPAIYEGLPVTEIASQAFYASEKLKTVIIPEGIVEIGSYAFYHCGSLESINFPTTLRRIKEYAFEGCDSITSVEIPWSINIGFRAFCECENLENIVIGHLHNGTAFVDGYAFYQCKKLESATLEGVTTIDSHAFTYCENLKTVRVSQDLIKIGDSAFEYCKSLETIYFHGTPEDYNVDYWPWWNKDTGKYNEVYTGK